MGDEIKVGQAVVWRYNPRHRAVVGHWTGFVKAIEQVSGQTVLVVRDAVGPRGKVYRFDQRVHISYVTDYEEAPRG